MTPTDQIGDFFAEIGQMLYREATGSPEAIFIYREVEIRLISGQSFKEFDDRVEYFFTNDVDMYILNFWESLPTENQWKAMQYSTKDGKFSVNLDYGEDWNENDYFDDRADRIVAARYGNKHIIYPRLPGDPD